MKLSWASVWVVARREFLAVVKRKAYVFTALGLPAYFGFVTYLTAAPQVSEQVKALKNLNAIGVVDSSGLFADAERRVSVEVNLSDLPFAQGKGTQRFSTEVRFFPTVSAAEAALRDGQVAQFLVIPTDYLESGHLRRYASSSSMFTSADQRPLRRWLVRGLLAALAPEERIERATNPTRRMDSYTLNRKTGQFEMKDDRRELVDFFLPFGLSMLLGLGIVTGGQYLLQGLAEEKESRILESLLCAVSADELLWGKMLGLGAAGLLLVAFWAGLAVGMAGPVVALLKPDPVMVLAALAYFVIGYVFYASILMGVGSVASTLREAMQFSWAFTFMNFIPFILITALLSQPNGALAVVLSLLPPTAPTTMMLRLAAPSSQVPSWQVLLSLAVLAGSSGLVLLASARIFRTGMLLYGKTPNLPEILRWARQK
jgi:ABC-2 type transport system permease protein